MRALIRPAAEEYAAIVDKKGMHALTTSTCHTAWMQLGKHSRETAASLRKLYDIRVVDGQPYINHQQMFSDLDRGILWVSRDNNEHPLWSKDTNVDFRIVHDIRGHYAAHRAGQVADFEWEGECNAFTWHERTLGKGAEGLAQALFTEVVGQAAYALHFGFFAPQAVGFMWGVS